jgi:hypothetical protein
LKPLTTRDNHQVIPAKNRYLFAPWPTNYNNMKILTAIFIISLTTSCVDTRSTELDFLVGTWKRENKELFEVWERSKPAELLGYSFRMDGNQEIVTETLVIKKKGDQFVYEATVPDQNEGRTVQFILSNETDSLFSFENDDHDFPKKIQYKIIDENQIEVIVLGGENKGFSYIQIRQ